MFHISDANDNPPLFTEDNYTVYVQEDKDFGYVVARFSVTDADESPNASPFTFDIRAGNEDNSFRGLFFVLLFMKFPKHDLRYAATPSQVAMCGHKLRCACGTHFGSNL